MLADAKDALIGIHPEPASLIFEDTKNTIAGKSISHGEAREFSVFESREATVVTSNPENSIGVFVQTAYVIARQTVPFGKSANFPFFHDRETAPRTDPNPAVASLQEC